MGIYGHEHALYTPNILAMHLPSIPHRSRGEKPLPKEQIEGGIHPICEFDKQCFFGDDELYAHMRERHEECFLCKRNEIRDQYFKNYEALVGLTLISRAWHTKCCSRRNILRMLITLVRTRPVNSASLSFSTPCSTSKRTWWTSMALRCPLVTRKTLDG